MCVSGLKTLGISLARREVVDHLGWSLEDWSRVVWTDESPFEIRSNSRFRCWIARGEVVPAECVKSTVKHEKKINVWGCFAAHAPGAIHRIHGIMDKHVFLDIMKNVALPSCETLFPADEDGDHDYMFQQDNDPKHTAIIVKEWMAENINCMNDEHSWWPAQSPDLNPIENLWAIVERKVQSRTCNSEEELFIVLEEAWKNLEPELLTSLVNSMPRRCAAVIASKGRPLKY